MKYTGSKARISKDLSNILNNIIEKYSINTYLEPFVGGANVIENIICDNKIGSDNNEYLISLWKAIQDDYVFPEFITKEDWYEAKENQQDYPKEYVGLVGVLASYNGCWFTSYGGYSKTKTGKDRNYYREAVNNVLKQKNKILDVKFTCQDYRFYSDIKNALIYCDPPYKQSKHRYRKGNEFNHEEFWEWVKTMSKDNIVLVSEYHPPVDCNIIWEKQLSKTHPDQVNASPTEKLVTYNDVIKDIV